MDDLFGVRFVGPSGQFEPGKLAAAEQKKLATNAVAIVQQLALWLPNDTQLLWQLGELANAHGDIRTAADIFESCVGQFALSSRTLRQHRALVQETLKEMARLERLNAEAAANQHAGHAGIIMPKSKRPLEVKPLDLTTLPPITKDGVNPLPWQLLLETNLDRHLRPAFPKHLQQLDGNRIYLNGFVQPLTDDLQLSVFMLMEYPTSCWYCEMPEITGLVLVELPEGQNINYTRNMVKITGKLSLNATDPENFLYTIKEAKVSEAD